MPHNLGEEEFLEWQILNAMSEDAYWESVKLGEEFVQFIIDHGRPVSTDNLTDDQKGWAKADFPQHFHNEMARWVVTEGSGKVQPYVARIYVHDRTYRSRCDCEQPVRKFWGTRWDGVKLMQCHNCGEVLESLARTNHANSN
jgi:hypothetical protein